MVIFVLLCASANVSATCATPHSRCGILHDLLELETLAANLFEKIGSDWTPFTELTHHASDLGAVVGDRLDNVLRGVRADVLLVDGHRPQHAEKQRGNLLGGLLVRQRFADVIERQLIDPCDTRICGVVRPLLWVAYLTK